MQKITLYKRTKIWHNIYENMKEGVELEEK